MRMPCGRHVRSRIYDGSVTVTLHSLPFLLEFRKVSRIMIRWEAELSPAAESTLDCAQSCSICASRAVCYVGREGEGGHEAEGEETRASGREVDPASWLRSSSISTTCATRNWGPSLDQPPQSTTGDVAL